MTKERQRTRAKRITVRSAIHDLYRGTLNKLNRNIELTVNERLQRVIGSMTNWQRHQWRRHCAAQPNHRKELHVAQAYACLDRATRAVKMDGLVVAHG